jgi:hypothetical protein
VEIEEAEHPVKLMPDLLFERTEGIVLVVADSQGAGLPDGLNGARSEVNGLIEPDQVGLVFMDRAEQIAIDAADDEVEGRYAVFDRLYNPRSGPVRRNVEGEDVLAESLEAAQPIPGSLPGTGIANTQNATFSGWFQGSGQAEVNFNVCQKAGYGRGWFDRAEQGPG